MKQGSKKILLILGFLVFAGLTLVFLAGTAAEKNSSPKIIKAAKPGETLNIKKAENKLYLENLQKFKTTTLRLEQKENEKFKEQTEKALNQLTELIKQMPKLSKKVKNEISKNLMNINRNAEKIALLENEVKLIDELKETFTMAVKTIEIIKDDLNCDKAIHKDLCQKLQKKLDKINKKTGQINEENYKQITKEVFMDFYSTLDYMYSQMSKPEFLTKEKSKKSAEKNINKTKKNNDDDKDKKDKDDNDDNDDKENKKDKEKSKCECQ